MSVKTKGRLSMLFMSVSFYMMITTAHTRALGDYVLEFIGLRSWTGDYSGTHLTVFYFGILFIIGLYLVEKYAVNGLNLRRRDLLIIFVLLMTVFYSITGMTVRYIKRNSSGLASIGYNSENSNLHYRSVANKIVEFTAELELTNYSNQRKVFYLSIDSPVYREDGVKEISFCTLDGKPVMFQLQGKETKAFKLSNNEYMLVGGRRFNNGSSGGIIEIVLTNDKGDKVRLEDTKGFVIDFGLYLQ